MEDFRSVHEPFEPCEKLEYVFLPTDPDKYFQIEQNMESTKRSELVSFLMNNLDVFAWDLYKVPRGRTKVHPTVERLTKI